MFKKIISLLLIVTCNFLMARFKLITHPDVQSEGNFYIKDGKLYSDALVINFRDNVVILSPGSKYAKISDFDHNYTKLNTTDAGWLYYFRNIIFLTAV